MFYVCSANSRGVLTPHTIHRMLFRYACYASSKTTIHKYGSSVSAHHYVRLARHALHVKPVPVSVRPQPFPDQYLRFGRLAADMRHAAVALCRCQNVGHGQYSFYNDWGSVKYAGGCVIKNPCFVNLYVCLGLFGLSADVGTTYPF